MYSITNGSLEFFQRFTNTTFKDTLTPGTQQTRSSPVVHKIMFHLYVLWLAFTYPIRRTYTANTCGHRTKKTGRIRAHGERIVMSIPLAKNGNPNYCLECIRKMSIRCAWCTHPIHVGDPVTLYLPQDSFEVPTHAVRYHENKDHFVGCLRWGCAHSGIDRQGFWVPPGKVERVPSPLEVMLSANNDHECSAVIVNDLSNPRDLGTIVNS